MRTNPQNLVAYLIKGLKTQVYIFPKKMNKYKEINGQQIYARCLMPLMFRERKMIKRTILNHLTPIRMAVIKMIKDKH